jgi:TonB family protein
MRPLWAIGVLVFLAGAIYFFGLSRDSKPPLIAAGEVVSVKGLVMGRASNQSESKKLFAQTPLSSPFQLVTGTDSEATIEFGERFRVLAQSSLLLEKVGPRYRIHLNSGHIIREKPQSQTEFIASQLPVPNQQLEISTSKDKAPTHTAKEQNSSPSVSSGPAAVPISADDKDDSDFESGSNLEEDEGAHPNEGEENEQVDQGHPAEDGETARLNPNLEKSKEQDLLRDTFKLHQRFMEKCFIQHLERHQGESKDGQILLRFTIQKNGRLRDIKIVKSAYADQDLHRCLLEVVERVRIKKDFKRPTTTEFPLQFKLP